MFDRQGFLDFLSYMGTVQLSEGAFSVSTPSKIDGVHTEVRVTSHNPLHLDPVKRLSYRRIDLTGRTFPVSVGNCRTYSELVERLRGQPVFKYRMVIDGKVECRFTTLSGADVKDDILPVLTVGDEVEVQVSETSDFYIGSFKLKIV